MVQVTCEKSGLVFEAATRRTKNHPTIMGWLSDAFKDGWNQVAYDTVIEGRKAGFTTIEQFVAALEQAKEKALTERDSAFAARRKAEQKRQEAYRQRKITNRFLFEHDYRWKDVGYHDQEIDNSIAYSLPEHDWQLFTPDHRIVSVKEAMQELAYKDVKFAKDWLAERNIPEETPAIEIKRQEQAAAEQAEQEKIVQWQSQMDEEMREYHEMMHSELLRHFSQSKADKLAYKFCQPHGPLEDQVTIKEFEDTTLVLALNGDRRYGLLNGWHWIGLDDALDMSEMAPHKNLLLEYRQRNIELRSQA